MARKQVVTKDASTGSLGTIIVSELAYSQGTVDLVGTGSPEGVVSAPVGSTYRRTDGGANTTFYVKESGSGNTGWVSYGPVGGGGSSLIPTSIQTSAYSASNNDLVLVDISSGGFTVTLPTATSGAHIAVKVVGAANANACTISRSDSDTIEGDTSLTLDMDYEYVELYGITGAWIIGTRS